LFCLNIWRCTEKLNIKMYKQFPDKINCLTLRLVGNILEYVITDFIS
jgi:hypothetical protein